MASATLLGLFLSGVLLIGALLKQTGIALLCWGNLVMLVVGMVMIYLAVVKKCEPFLLMSANTFLTMQTMDIVGLGLIAFIFGTGSGIITAKVMNLFLKTKINPLIASAGIAARVSHRVANKENPNLFLIYHAMGPNLAGVFGTAISGGILLALLGVK